MKRIALFSFLLAIPALTAAQVLPAATAPATGTATSTANTPEGKAAELLKQGRKLHAEGKLDEALQLYDKALAIAPDSWDAHVAIGAALDLKGNYSEARKHLQKAIDLADEEHKPGALRSMAMSYAFEGKMAEGAKFERQAEQSQRIAKKPVDAAGTLNELARLLLEAGEFDKAYDAYKEGYFLAIQTVTKPEDKDLWNFRWEHAQARLAARRGLKEEAAKHVSAAKAILDKNTNPNQAIFFPYLTGYVAYYAGDYKTARSEFQKADQKDPFILAMLAQSSEKIGDTAQAKDYWTKVIGIYSHNPTNAYARPLAKKALGM